MLEEVIRELSTRLSQQRGFNTPHEIVILPELPLDSKNRERILIIKAGSPPTILLSRLYIEASLVRKRDANGFLLPTLRETIERALEYLPKMYHTLSLVPIRDAVALRKDSKNWMKSLVPEYRSMLSDSNFSCSYSITVTDNITGTSVTRNGKDVKEITQQAKRDLSKLIIESEEMEEYRENKRREEWAKELAAKPNEVSLIVGNTEGIMQGEIKIETKMEY